VIRRGAKANVGLVGGTSYEPFGREGGKGYEPFGFWVVARERETRRLPALIM